MVLKQQHIYIISTETWPPQNVKRLFLNFYNFCFLHHSYKLDVLCFVDLEQREDAARVNKENDETAAKNLQAEVS